MKDKKTLKTENATIHQTNENCQVFNGPISGCVFALPGATVHQHPVQQVKAGDNGQPELQEPNEGKELQTLEPLRPGIFDTRIFNTDERLRKLRDTIAAAIDMGDATIMYGQPQQVRINPTIQSEWYYIMKAIKESGVAKTAMGDTTFVEQMVDWFPMLIPDDSAELFKAHKRNLARSISGERSLWKQGNLKTEVTLKDMWAKHIERKIGQVKAERVYAIACTGLWKNLDALKHEIERENNRGNNAV